MENRAAIPNEDLLLRYTKQPHVEGAYPRTLPSTTLSISRVVPT